MEASPRLKKDIAQVFRNVKDKRALPFFEKLLDDTDIEMRYAGMDGIYGICGGRKSGFVYPAYDLFRANPEAYLAPYKAWCAQQHAAP